MARKRSFFFLLSMALFNAQYFRMRMSIILCLLRMIYEQKRRRRYSLRDRIPKQIIYLHDLVSDHRDAIHDNLRLSKFTFAKLCHVLKHRVGLRPGKYVSTSEMVASFLGVLAHHRKQREQKFNFCRSTETVHRWFHTVLCAILKLQDVLFVKPRPIIGSRPFNYFENCLGALDGCYIDVTVKESEQPRWRTRKGRVSTNVLGVCDDKMKFIYMLSGWEGSAADGRVLKDALTRNPGFRVLRGCHYLADSGYTNSPGFLTPYRGIRYHLKEWGQGNRAPQNEQEYYNMRHAQARNVIERVWGLMKKRWEILRSPSFYPIKVQIKIIIACGILHNFIRNEMDVDPWEVDVPMDYTEEDVDNEINTVESTYAWTTWRYNFARRIYHEWRISRGLT